METVCVVIKHVASSMALVCSHKVPLKHAVTLLLGCQVGKKIWFGDQRYVCLGGKKIQGQAQIHFLPHRGGINNINWPANQAKKPNGRGSSKKVCQVVTAEEKRFCIMKKVDCIPKRPRYGFRWLLSQVCHVNRNCILYMIYIRFALSYIQDKCKPNIYSLLASFPCALRCMIHFSGIRKRKKTIPQHIMGNHSYIWKNLALLHAWACTCTTAYTV